MAKKKRGDAHTGGHVWFVTFADLMGLMMSFFVMLVAFSNQDQQKLKIVAGSMRDAFGVQTQARYSGIIESDGLPTRPKLKNTEHINPEEASNTPTPDEQDRNRIQDLDPGALFGNHRVRRASDPSQAEEHRAHQSRGSVEHADPGRAGPQPNSGSRPRRAIRESSSQTGFRPVPS